MALRNGSKAWIGLAVYVSAYDVWAAVKGKETLSEAFYAAVCHPVKRWQVGVAWTYITAHLFHVIPEDYDPLRRWPRPKP